jgi:hypothetical protein
MNQKHFFTLIALGTLAMALHSCLTITKKDNGQTIIKFSQIEAELGNLEKNHPATITFNFENTGTKPLVIYTAEASCGCTQPEYPDKPIEPGHKGEIKVTYDAKAPGRFNKTINVYHNGKNGLDVLKISGTVVGDISEQ